MSADRSPRPWVPLAFIVALPLAWSLLALFRFGRDDAIYTAWRGGAAIPALAVDAFWRVITAPLLHVDPVHLVANLVVLSIVVVMARRVSDFPLLLVAALSAWSATAIGVLTRPGWALGASAAFYGLVGGVAAGAMRDRSRRPLVGQILIVAFVAIALGPGDRPAHLIGLVTGAAFAYLPTSGTFSRWLHGAVLGCLLLGVGLGAAHSDDPPSNWHSVTTGEGNLKVPVHWVQAAAVGPCAEVYTDGLRAACALFGPQTTALSETLAELGYRGAPAIIREDWTIRHWSRVVGPGVLIEAYRGEGGQTILLTVGTDRGFAPWMVPERFAP